MAGPVAGERAISPLPLRVVLSCVTFCGVAVDPGRDELTIRPECQRWRGMAELTLYVVDGRARPKAPPSPVVARVVHRVALTKFEAGQDELAVSALCTPADRLAVPIGRGMAVWDAREERRVERERA